MESDCSPKQSKPQAVCVTPKIQSHNAMLQSQKSTRCDTSAIAPLLAAISVRHCETERWDITKEKSKAKRSSRRLKLGVEDEPVLAGAGQPGLPGLCLAGRGWSWPLLLFSSLTLPRALELR
eukprot:s1261_g21.t1